MELGSTFGAFASLRMVTKLGFCFPNSRRQMVSNATPDLAAKVNFIAAQNGYLIAIPS